MLIELTGVVQSGKMVLPSGPGDPRAPLRIQNGSDVGIRVEVFDPNGQPLDVSAGSFYLAVRSPMKEIKRLGSAVAEWGPNVLLFQLVSTEILLMGPGKFQYDVWWVHVDGEVFLQEAIIPTSPFIVEPSVYPIVAGAPTVPSPVPVPPVTPGGSGWVYVENVAVTDGIADQKVWEDPPGNTLLQEVRCSGIELEVTVRASYPKVMVATTLATLTRDPVGGYYRGTVAITFPLAGDLECYVETPDGEEGATDTVAVTFNLPPNISDVRFTGAYPTGPGGLQAELKEDDSFSVTVTADKPFDRVEFLDYGASKAVTRTVAAGPPGSPQTSTVTMVAANRGTTAQQLAARVKVRDADSGAYSDTRDTNYGGGTTDGVNVVTLNNLFPSGAVSGIAYPPTQAALKGVEATPAPGVQNTAANYSSILYSDPTGAQLTIANPTAFEANKVATCRAPGVFNNSTTNFRYVMTRNANGAQTTVNAVVVVADVAPTIMILKPAARLRSGGNNGTAVQNHTIIINSNQPLLNAPTLNADSGGSRGTFSGSWAGGPTNWTRVLVVSELVPDEKGTFAFEGLVATGLAGLVQNMPAGGSQAYVLGGFVSRNLTFAAFAEYTNIGTAVVDFAKLTAGIFTATNQPALKQAIGTGPSVTNGYTIVATGVNPTSLRWLDTPAVNSNSSGTAQITNVAEGV